MELLQKKVLAKTSATAEVAHAAIPMELPGVLLGEGRRDRRVSRRQRRLEERDVLRLRFRGEDERSVIDQLAVGADLELREHAGRAAREIAAHRSIARLQTRHLVTR